jgi:molecular chaperone DnaK (HSP70)
MDDEQKPAKRYRGANKQPTMVYVSVRIKQEQYQWLKEVAEKNKIKLSDALRAAIQHTMNKQENNDAV